MSLRVKQDSTYKGTEWWRWSVWLDGSAKELAAVDHVVYTLHPTFPDPVQVVKDRRGGFRLDSSGWGEFQIYVQIHPKSGKPRKLRHWLTLPYPSKDAGAAPPRRGATPPPSGEQPRTAYLSAGADNAALGRRIRDVLSARGFRVVSMDDVAAGVPIETGVDRLLGGAEAAIFLLSGKPSLWTRTEVARAKAHNVPHLVPVVVGTAAELPSELRGIQAVQVDEKMNVERLADQILKAV
jgi:hypothetical protein